MENLKSELKESEAKTIVQLGHMFVSEVIDEHKRFLRENNLVYEGKVVDISFDIDGPTVKFDKSFEDWVFKNASILKNNIELILIIGEKDAGTGRNKRKTNGTRGRHRKDSEGEE